jgi:heme/copper-type cytochrome/quinol oxidase subunit 3
MKPAIQGETEVLDVSRLPTYGFGHRSLAWWGTLGLMIIEGMVFALTVAAYFYLRSHSRTWPMNAAPPELIWGTVNTVILLLSLLPNHLAKRAGERLDRKAAQLWMAAGLLFALACIGVRVLEFGGLNTRWDSQAYGSAVWMLMVMHTLHLVTDAFDTAVLLVLMFTGPLEGKRFVDVSENAMYWVFVVLSWLPIYVVIYWVPRM